jgi:outer membrane protein assembly factor BamB
MSQGDSNNLSLQPYGKDTFYVTTLDGSIYKLDDFDIGHPVWRLDTGDNLISSKQKNESFLIPSIRGNLYQFSNNSGIRKIKLNVKDLVNLSPFISSPDSVWIGSKSSSIYVIDFHTGDLICKYNLNDYGNECQTNGTSFDHQK